MDIKNIEQVKIFDNFEEVKDIVNAHFDNGWVLLIAQDNKAIIGADWPESYNMKVNLTVRRKHFGICGKPDAPRFPGVI